MQIQIPTPRNFSFPRTVLSHGWYVLPPFEFDREKWTLTRVIDLDTAKPVTITIRAAKRRLLVETARSVGKRASEKIVRDVRHMFRLDDDMNSFYGEVSYGSLHLTTVNLPSSLGWLYPPYTPRSERILGLLRRVVG